VIPVQGLQEQGSSENIHKCECGGLKLVLVAAQTRQTMDDCFPPQAT